MEKSLKINQIINESLAECQAQFNKIDAVALHNQRKVLTAFQNNNVALQSWR